MKKGNPLFRPPHYSGEALWADNAAMILPPAAFRLSPPALRAGTRFIVCLSDNTIQLSAYALSSSSTTVAVVCAVTSTVYVVAVASAATAANPYWRE